MIIFFTCFWSKPIPKLLVLTIKSSSKLLNFSLVITLCAFLLGFYVHPVFLSFCGLTMSYFFPVSVEWINENFKDISHLLISSSMTSIGLILMLMHQLFGLLTEGVGLNYAFLSFLFFNLGSFLVFHLLRRSHFLKFETK